jgi:alpha-glutamyl/putrescinyl thymine pyrophosphorylase clade 1
MSNSKQPLTPPELFLYWIQERNQVMLRKTLSLPKPWSNDETFQRTYFCNVRREHDRVTQFIRSMYSREVQDRWFEYNIILSRFINWPPSLVRLGYISGHDPEFLESKLEDFAKTGKVWGGAYVITTHGIPMGKAAYLCHNVLGGVAGAMDNPLGPFWGALRPKGAGSCKAAHIALQGLEGLGSFLAAQVVADLKNTPGHPLYTAPDKDTFVAHGPGSIRGLSWFWNNITITTSSFLMYFAAMREYVDEHWNQTLMGYPIDNQDLQNCLCEFDKYCRVSTGAGRSKRNYPGTTGS